MSPGRSSLLRIRAHLWPAGGPTDWTGVRVLLVTDLLARATELQGLQVLATIVFGGALPPERSFAERVAGLLGCHPPSSREGSPQISQVPTAKSDVHIAGPGTADEQLGNLVVRAGAVHVQTGFSREGPELRDVAMSAASDPLAIRFALMARPVDHAVDLDDSVVARACNTTSRWREQVADWAESPSRPIPTEVRAAFDAAFRGLDIPLALQLLVEAEQEAGMPNGARFETFAFADRVLGLELTRHVGRPRG